VCPTPKHTWQGFPATLYETEVTTMRTHTKTFHIRFTEKECKRLCEHSKKAGLPKSTYIRHMINGCSPQEYPAEMFRDFMEEIRRVGNNLNQLTKLAHRVGSLHAGKLDGVLEEHRRIYIAIHRAVVLPESVNIPATLERGRLLADVEQTKGGSDNDKAPRNSHYCTAYKTEIQASD